MTLEQEIKSAQEKYGHYNSTHEVYGVLKEEVDEFWELVKNNHTMKAKIGKIHFRDAMILELQQIAAVALRAAQELKEQKIKFV